MAGNDVRSMNTDTLAILTNKEAIAIDQDSLGKQGFRFRVETGGEIWLRVLANGEWALFMLNTGTASADLTIDWSITNWTFKGVKFKIRDLWSGKDLGTTENPLTQTVQAHDVVFVRLTPLPGSMPKA